MMDIGGHLGGLFRFAGRERRTTFWLWVLISYLAYMAVATIGMVPMMTTMFSRMHRFTAEHPELGQPGAPPPPPAELFQLMPLEAMIAVSAISFVFVVLLLAAAVARRLHDTGRSGWWGLMPFPFLIVTMALFARVFHGVLSLRPGRQEPFFPPEFAGLFVGDIGYLATLVTLIVFCCLPTQEQPNRFGPPPGQRAG